MAIQGITINIVLMVLNLSADPAARRRPDHGEHPAQRARLPLRADRALRLHVVILLMATGVLNS
jgi:hypothetical protein